MSEIVYVGQDFTEDEARRLTADIKAWAGTLWVKLRHAHDGKAWKALGYSTWADYLAGEFDISKSRGYQLVAHARAVAALAESAGVDESTIVDIPEGRTRDLDIDAVADEIAERTAGLPEDTTDEDRAKVVDEVVNEHRGRITETKTETTVTEFDPETGEILSQDSPPTDPPAVDGDGALDPAPSPPQGPGSDHIAPAPERPTMASVGDLVDWCPDDGRWSTYEEMQRDDGTRQFARLMDRRLPRDEDADVAGLCPVEALRSAAFAAEAAATYWTDLAADLRRRMHPATNDGRHLAAVGGTTR